MPQRDLVQISTDLYFSSKFPQAIKTAYVESDLHIKFWKFFEKFQNVKSVIIDSSVIVFENITEFVIVVQK